MEAAKETGGEIADHPILNDMTIQYMDFSKRLGQLIANMRAHHAALLTLSNTSVAVANDMAGLAMNTPLAETVGKPSQKEANNSRKTNETKKGNPTLVEDIDATPSYVSIHESFAAQAKESRTHFGEMVLDVVVQWEFAVTTRINSDLKMEKRLREELVLHEEKVQALQRKIDSSISKGKSPKEEWYEKFDRKSKKVEEAREQYEDFVSSLCLLMDEVVHRSWRDLQPVLLEMSYHDIQFSTDHAKTMQKLKTVIHQVKQIGEEDDSVSTRRLVLLEDLPVMIEDDDFQLFPEKPDSKRNRSPGSSTKRSKKKKRVYKPFTKSPPLDNSVSKEEILVPGTPPICLICSTEGAKGNLLKAALDERDEHGRTRLGIAAWCGHVKCIQRLLDQGAGVNDPDGQGSSPLHHASEMGYEGCLKLLLDHEAALDAVDGEGFTPLHLACEQGKSDVVKRLVEKGAPLDASHPESWRPIHLAAQNGHLGCLEVLLQGGANVTKTAGDPWTALHLAAAGGFQDCIKALIEAGACVDDTDRSGSTPLQKACENGHRECVRILLDHKADPNKMDDEGFTPLIATALEGHVDVMKRLLVHGAKVDQAHPDGWTPLHLSAEHGFPKCIELLLKHGAQLEAKNEDGWTALHKAAERGNVDCLDRLLTSGADLEVSNKDGFRALHVASFNGHPTCIELLLDRKARIDEQDGRGCTALHWAASQGQLECAKVLIERSADTTILDARGNTPSQAAKINGF